MLLCCFTEHWTALKVPWVGPQLDLNFYPPLSVFAEWAVILSPLANIVLPCWVYEAKPWMLSLDKKGKASEDQNVAFHPSWPAPLVSRMQCSEELMDLLHLRIEDSQGSSKPFVSQKCSKRIKGSYKVTSLSLWSSPSSVSPPTLYRSSFPLLPSQKKMSLLLTQHMCFSHPISSVLLQDLTPFLHLPLCPFRI